MKHIIIIILVCFCALISKAQTINYVPAMKPFIGEWVHESGQVTMTLVIEKVGTNKVTAKYKAVNYEDGRPRTFYTDYEKIQWSNGKFIFSYKSDDPDRNLLIKNIATIKGKTLTLLYQCWEGSASGYQLKWEQEIGKFHVNW